MKEYEGWVMKSYERLLWMWEYEGLRMSNEGWRMRKYEGWMMSNEGWRMREYEWWVMKGEGWVMKLKDERRRGMNNE